MRLIFLSVIKILWYLLNVVVTSGVDAAGTSGIDLTDYHPWKRTQLTTVLARFPELEEFYMGDMRLQKPDSYLAERDYPPDVVIDVKKTLCNKILNNHDRVKDEFCLNLDDKDVRAHLRDNNWNIYQKIFKLPKKNDSSLGCFPCVSAPKFEYVNPYTKVDFTIAGKTVTERVFLCLGFHEKEKKVVEYYVSEEYNVNVKRRKTEDYEPPYITGRFIFAKDRALDDWMLFEMAEESAILTKPDVSFERLYLRYRKKRKIASEASDPVCGLKDSEKMRICISILNATEVSGSANSPHFKPVFNNLRPYTPQADLDCKEMEVLFTDEIPQQRPLSIYTELTISCIVETRQDTTETFIVSRGYSMNSVFVFRPFGNGMVVDNHSSNISVVIDDNVSNIDET